MNRLYCDLPDPWPDAKCRELETLWRQGQTVSAIASKLKITRNAVIGKAHRMGLPRRQPGAKRRAAE